jgi:UDP-glucose 4-epimerase
MKILVTGGSGFIGSYLVDALLSEGNEIIIFDNMSSGSHTNEKCQIIKGDLLNPTDLEKIPKVDEVWHLAANPEVRVGDPDIHEKQNHIATKNILDWMKNRGVDKIYFTSTSTVYGEAEQIPTPESSPLNPISPYGSSKVSAEAEVTSSGINYIIFRFANVIGQRGHGVIIDLINKLKQNPNELEILGDGKQSKSYVHISDCVSAMMFSRKFSREILNIGTSNWITVDKIADIISEKMNLKPKYSYTGGSRGWKGDVPKMLLSIEKIKALGWYPKYDSKSSAEKTVEDILG